MTEQCHLRKGNTCQLVSELAMIPLPICVITDKACTHCIKEGKNNAVNYVTVGVALSTLRRNKLYDSKKHAYLKKALTSRIGPGRILAEKLWWIAKPDDGLCYCKSRASIMDAWGPDKCKEEIETIVGWLMEGAEKHSVSWVPKNIQALAARKAIEWAINKARKHEKAL